MYNTAKLVYIKSVVAKDLKMALLFLKRSQPIVVLCKDLLWKPVFTLSSSKPASSFSSSRSQESGVGGGGEWRGGKEKNWPSPNITTSAPYTSPV